MKCPNCGLGVPDTATSHACGWRASRSARSKLPRAHYPNAVAHFDRVLAYLDSLQGPANVEPLAKEIRMLRDQAVGGSTTATEIDRKTTELEARWDVEVNPYEPRTIPAHTGAGR